MSEMNSSILRERRDLPVHSLHMGVRLREMHVLKVRGCRAPTLMLDKGHQCL